MTDISYIARQLGRLDNRLLATLPAGTVNTMSDVPQRWTKASVYPDMWADPGEDPRDSDGVSPDGELATLQDYMKNYRLTLLMKCEGLDPEQMARRSVPPSTMSLLGLVRHLADAERAWRNWITPEDPSPKRYGAGDAAFDGAVAEQAAAEGAFADLAREQTATDAVLAQHPHLGECVGHNRIAVRELWVHRIEEYARHCGHADLLRERIDGRVGQ
ncbi:MAG: DinB family protein [Trebonia sp.]